MEINDQASGERKLECSDVTKCFQLLESILDGELGDSGKEILKDKLAKCQPCFEHFHLEEAIRDVLKTKCTKQPVPTELADSIRQMIKEGK
ncbi:mycothiol system anti-sigma-R factor [Algoriphagus terrigena]|uniref:mycothiol system anti-sigma-R factor n=1 Tax=Algoriphagus terrigena TaxID=344884 RepID=UPI00041818A0|nr:mycothiol system anti-sigma-R factor [Algoriphagus terrigena]